MASCQWPFLCACCLSLPAQHRLRRVPTCPKYDLSEAHFHPLSTTSSAMQVTVDDVEKLMEDSAEAQAQQDRLHHALAGSLTPEQDAAAAEELAALEATAEAEEAAALDLPSVPHTQAQAQAEDSAALDLSSVPQTEVATPPQRRPAEAAPQREDTRQLEEPIAA